MPSSLQQEPTQVAPTLTSKWKRDGIYIVNLKRTREKPLRAAHAIVAVGNPADVGVITSRDAGQRAASLLGATALMAPDPGACRPHLAEGAYAHLPATPLCDSDSALCYGEDTLPCNRKGAPSGVQAMGAGPGGSAQV